MYLCSQRATYGSLGLVVLFLNVGIHVKVEVLRSTSIVSSERAHFKNL